MDSIPEKDARCRTGHQNSYRQAARISGGEATMSSDQTAPSCPMCGTQMLQVANGDGFVCKWHCEEKVKPELSKTAETADLIAKLVLLLADQTTLPPQPDQLRQIFNTAAELRRCVARVGEFAEEN